MLKNLKSKNLIVSGVVIGSILLSTPISVLAAESTDVVANPISSSTTVSINDQLMEQLKYAVIEAQNTEKILKEANFTEKGQWELMSSYIKAAVARVDGLRFNGIENDQTKHIYDVLDKVNRSYNSIVGRIQNATNGLEDQFNNGSLEGKEIAVQQLEQIIKEEKGLNYEYANKNTVDAATKILDQYKLKLELARAVHEANYTESLLKESDFTKRGSWEYMASFIKAAVARVDGVRFNGIENKDTKYVYDVLDKVNRSYNSVVGRIQNATNGLEDQFNNGSLQGKEIAVQQLEQIIKEEKELNYEYANKNTVDAATKILDQYKLKLELARAVHEANYTESLLKESDFTKKGSWEYMASFIKAAVARVDGVRFNGIENKDTQYVYNVLNQVNIRYNGIVGRIQNAVNGLEAQKNNGTPEGLNVAVNQLRKIINEEKGLKLVNRVTLESAQKILDQYTK